MTKKMIFRFNNTRDMSLDFTILDFITFYDFNNIKFNLKKNENSTPSTKWDISDVLPARRQQ